MSRAWQMVVAAVLAVGLALAVGGCSSNTPGVVVGKHHYGTHIRGACGELTIRPDGAPDDGSEDFTQPVVQTVFEECEEGERWPHCKDELLVPGLNASCS